MPSELENSQPEPSNSPRSASASSRVSLDLITYPEFLSLSVKAYLSLSVKVSL